MKDLVPQAIVRELDRYIVGQEEAKRCVAIAIRNRWRRQQLPPDFRDEVLPKNIIMIGPTGVGKTEIARRLSQLVGAPFIKVEASRYTEVGYVGRDVESMVRDLVDVAVKTVKSEELQTVEREARERTEERILDLLHRRLGLDPGRREETRSRLRAGEFEGQDVEFSVDARPGPFMEVFPGQNIEQLGFDFQKILDRFMPGRSMNKRMSVVEARRLIHAEESEKLIDTEKIHGTAVHRAETSGIIFLDEIDKITGSDAGHGPDVSREGVQRDLLPVIEGSTVSTRYGIVRTDHILFIAAGAFHTCKPSDLIPELQGRFPIRVELRALTRDDLVRIMTEPRNALTKQYSEMLRTEGVDIEFTEAGIRRMAEIAASVNERSQNIGARRLYTIFEKLLEKPLFEAPDTAEKRIVVDPGFVDARLGSIIADEDLTRFIL